MEVPEKLFHFFSMDQPGKGQLYESIMVNYEGKSWKFARYYSTDIVYELFDLTDDPIAYYNLYGNPEYQPIQKYLYWIMGKIHPDFS